VLAELPSLISRHVMATPLMHEHPAPPARVVERTQPAPAIPLRLDLIHAPRPEHVDEIARVRRLTADEIHEGLQVAEVMLRGVIAAGRDHAAKAAADALSDWIRRRHRGDA